MKEHKRTRSVAVSLFLWFTFLFPFNGPVFAVDPAIEDYTAYPQFIADTVKPNILIIMDNSGSMNEGAYGFDADGNYHPDDFETVVYKQGVADAGDAVSLTDNTVVFPGAVNVGDLVRNTSDGSIGVITSINGDHTLEIAAGMSGGDTNDIGESYRLEVGYYGYFVPTARYSYSSNVFVRDEVNGEWSGSFLNWVSMRRVDLARKVIVGGLATSRTGGGNTHLIGETPPAEEGYRKFLKFLEDTTSYTPYDNRHFYKMEGGKIEVYKLNDGEPGFDYTREFMSLYYDQVDGDDHFLSDYTFDYIGGDTYEISYHFAGVSGTADGIIDRNSDGSYGVYRNYLFDPSRNFIGAVQPGDLYVNDSEGSTGYVTAVPESVPELLASLPDDILYDMFHNDMNGYDGYVSCLKCSPDVYYLPCQDDGSMGECEADGDLEAVLASLIGHIVIFSTPLVPFGPNNGERYHFEATATATKVASYVVEVARDSTYLDEAPSFNAEGNISGVIQNIGDRARFGLEFYNQDEGGEIVQSVGSGLTDLITRIENRACKTETPLAESLYEGVRYFQQIDPYYAVGDFVTNDTNDPYYFKDIARFVECSGSFVLQITDGESTYDQNIPFELQDYDMDGADGAVYPNNGSDYLDDVALWANTTDLRPDDEPGGLEGTQNLIYYTVFAFGHGSTLLKDAARNGGFKDVNGDNLPEPPGGDPETIRLEWDKDQDGDPDTYFEAPSGFELERKIYQAITAILKRAASGTAVSVLSTSERGEGTVYQAFFKPKTSEGGEDITWLGYLQGLWIDEKGNLREDTEPDGRLVLEDDKILRYRFDLGTQQTFVDRYTDADGDGKIDNLDAEGNPVPDDSILLENMEGIWEAGKLLAERSPDSRRIFTFVDSDWDQVAGETEIFEFNTDAVSLPAIAPYLETLGTDPMSYSYLGAEADRAGNLVQFIRGDHIDEMRNRSITVDGIQRVWKLGDIVYSTPTVVGPPLAAYERIYSDPTYLEYATLWKDREGMLFIGANDGMLHAFRTGSFISGDDPSTTTKEEVGYLESSYGDVGSEAWAYIPFNLLPHLKWLADPDYTHVFYTDLKVKVGDVKIFPDDPEHPNGWGTLLIGGMRLGGGPYPSGEVIDGSQKYYRSAFFLMDITDSDNPEILAEFSHPGMGFTTSYPTITKIDDQWFMVMGSGPSPGAAPPFNYDGTSDQFAKIFVLNLTMFMSTKQIREGVELTVLDGFIDNAFMSDPVGVDKDLDFNVDVIYLGESVWASNKWKGRIYRLKTGGAVNPADWQLSSLFVTPTYKSISAAPGVAAGFNETLWVYFGTGRFANDADKTDVNVQSLYGIHDACMDSGASCATTYDEGDLYDMTDVSVYTSDRDVMTQSEVEGASGGEITFSELESKFKDGTYLGWKTDLPDLGERSLTKPSVLGGAALFTTYTPSSDICSMGGDGKLYALYFLTGTAYKKPILAEDETTHESLKSVSMGKGMPASLGLHVGTKKSGTALAQMSTGNIMQVDIYPPLSYKSGDVSWREN